MMINSSDSCQSVSPSRPQHQKIKQDTPFTLSLTNILNGTAALERLSHTLVSGVVSEVIGSLATQYGFEAVEAEAMTKDIVTKWSSSSMTRSANDIIICAATARSGKRCTRRAVTNGFCFVHKASAASHPLNKEENEDDERENEDPNEAEKRRRIQSYAEALRAMPAPPPASQQFSTFTN